VKCLAAHNQVTSASVCQRLPANNISAHKQQDIRVLSIEHWADNATKRGINVNFSTHRHLHWHTMGKWGKWAEGNPRPTFLCKCLQVILSPFSGHKAHTMSLDSDCLAFLACVLATSFVVVTPRLSRHTSAAVGSTMAKKTH